jgi:putative DNA primase/helicase
MMDQSTGSDECDDCDGIYQNSPELEKSVENETICSTDDRGQKEEKEILEEVLEMPSQIRQLKTRTNTEYEVENNQLAITVGDLVMVDDCPGHWSWASPFTVEAIDGEMVKLEMVSELVEIKRLSVING